MASVAYIAAVAHSVNRAYCTALGELSQPTWNDAPQWQKDSAIAGVKFHLANPNAGPAASHESWLAQKKAEGWQWGPIKDADRKLHPCFCIYADLPQEQQAKDYLFCAIVHSMMDFEAA